jgi:hypothetical protein
MARQSCEDDSLKKSLLKHRHSTGAPEFAIHQQALPDIAGLKVAAGFLTSAAGVLTAPTPATQTIPAVQLRSPFSSSSQAAADASSVALRRHSFAYEGGKVTGVDVGSWTLPGDRYAGLNQDFVVSWLDLPYVGVDILPILRILSV